MKSKQWEEMTALERRTALINSARGSYLVGQALAIACRVMRNAPHPWREESNAQDCAVLGALFEPFFTMELTNDRPILTENRGAKP